jgi:acyl-CoA synthetase (AMP-forming)/AMP-acid ligase II
MSVIGVRIRSAHGLRIGRGHRRWFSYTRTASQVELQQILKSGRNSTTLLDEQSSTIQIPFDASSHVIGPSFPSLSDHTIGSLIEQAASSYGSLPAVISVHQKTTVTYAELNRISSIVASNLAHVYHIRKGDKVAVCCGNLWEYPVLQVALGRLGAVLVPLNPAFTTKQFISALQGSDTKALIIQSSLSQGRRNPPKDTTELVAEIRKEVGTLEHVFVIPKENEQIDTATNNVKLASGLLKQPTHVFSYFPSHPDEVINMQFTSGTTSMPKISSLTHRNIVNNGLFIGNRMGLSATRSNHPTGQDHVCVPVPMFHCFGLVLSNMASFATGACLVYPSDSFDPVATVTAVREHSCTALHGVPTMFAAELDLEEEIAKGGLQYLRTGIAAGSSVPIEMMKRLSKTFNLDELTICYGMTETSPVSFMSFPNDPVEKRTATVGTIMPHTEAKVVAPADDTMTALPIGTPGEIIVAGYLLQKEYFKDPERTAEAMVVDGEGKRWMRTGDEGVIDAEGFLTVTGRIKDLIIRGGENIHPLEIENVLFTHDAVLQASVVGVPDEKYGEAVCAFVALERHYREHPPSVEELQALVKDHLGHYMVPKYFFFVEDFPKTASGKIRKVDLKKTAAKWAIDGQSDQV